MSKKTLVLGASPNPMRFANKAIFALTGKGHDVVAVGLRKGKVAGVEILQGKPHIYGVDTITLYMGEKHQPQFYDYILSLNPKRIIFNPGTQNKELKQLAHQNDIETLDACTLVMLSIGNY